jgi:hypothetical protein
MNKKITAITLVLTMIISLCCGLSVFAEETTVTVDNITYSLNSTDKTATVRAYAGTDVNVEIPSAIWDNGEKYNVTSVYEGAFSHNETVKSVILPETIEKVDVGAFAECVCLESITLPSNNEKFTEIPYKAFYMTPKLESINIPNTVKRIDTMAFCYSGLTNIVIPKSVETIGNGVFALCPYLKSAVFLNDTLEICAGNIVDGGDLIWEFSVPEGYDKTVIYANDAVKSAIIEQQKKEDGYASDASCIASADTTYSQREATTDPVSIDSAKEEEVKEAIADAGISVDTDKGYRLDRVSVKANGTIRVAYVVGNAFGSKECPTEISGDAIIGVLVYNIPSDTVVSSPMVYVK